MHESHVAMWRKRFRTDGLKGLADQPRPGRPPTYGHDDILKMAALATTARDPNEPEATWTYKGLADELRDDVEISHSQLWRILDDMNIKPHRFKGWINRRDDPEFWDRVQDVCGLYLEPPDNAVVMSVDEKTSMQAKERVCRTTPAGPGRACREEFEYVRHGTASDRVGFLHHQPASVAPRELRVTDRPGRQAHTLHRPLQPNSETVRLDLQWKATKSSCINARRTCAQDRQAARQPGAADRGQGDLHRRAVGDGSARWPRSQCCPRRVVSRPTCWLCHRLLQPQGRPRDLQRPGAKVMMHHGRVGESFISTVDLWKRH